MHETTRLAGLIQERIDDVVSAHLRELEPLGPDSLRFLQEVGPYLAGGKRMRAQFALLGYSSVRRLEFNRDPDDEFSLVLDAACALELFHAAALVHDDVIDRSDTRRGRPSAHKLFEAAHRQQGWLGSSMHFGTSVAILLGDLLQSWADELFQRSCDATGQASLSRAARAHFNRMRSEVAVGQYLDVLEEQRVAFPEQREQLERSTRVLVYKSAKYSVEAPLLIGAALAGADEQQEEALSEFGLPVGVAFQLRDDLLGVFGDSEITGKPSGDDLLEGKRTVLVVLAREALPATQRRLFDEMLGDAELDQEQLSMLQTTIRDSGAVEKVEQMISRNLARAEAALDFAPLDHEVRERLILLARKAARRLA